MKNNGGGYNMVHEWIATTFNNKRGSFSFFPQLCKGCGLCIQKCPTQVIEWSEQLAFNGAPGVKPRMEGCIVCGICQNVCPEPAISILRHDQKPAAVSIPRRPEQ
jgi:2-oxoglutarate ferredoxin oxidoreductase subunit delta